MNILKTQRAFEEIKDFIQTNYQGLDDFEKSELACARINLYKDVDEINLVKALSRFFLNF